MFQNDIYMDYMYTFGISCGQLVQALDAIQCYFEVYSLSTGNSMNETLSLQGDGACLIKLGCDSLNDVILLRLVSRELYLLPVLRPLKGITFMKRPNDGGMSFQRTKLTLSFIHCFQSSSKISTPKNPSIIPIINKGCCD